MTARLGPGITIKGDVIVSEDLQIEGHVEGRIELRDHRLLIGPHATVRAHVIARAITIMGAVTGTVTASDTVDLRESSSVNGDIYAARVVMADGAQLNGKIDTLSHANERQPARSVAV